MPDPARALARRLPFFYGWVVVAVAFVTLGAGATVRSAFSLLFAPILAETGWERGLTASVFTLGFLAGAAAIPLIGAAIDRFGPQLVLPVGAVIMATGFALATLARDLWHYYATLGVLVVGGSMVLAYNAHFLFLPGWFDRRRGLAIGIASAGVGSIAMATLPWLQTNIDRHGWRTACLLLAAIIVVVLVPVNFLLQRRHPRDLGLEPDGVGDSRSHLLDQTKRHPPPRVVDAEWAKIEWTLARAMRTARFWLFTSAFLLAMLAWYAILVHQTKFLLDRGFDPTFAAFALGMVPLLGVASQILLGLAADRLGREWVWTIAGVGFLVAYVAMAMLELAPSTWLVWVLVVFQGLGYGMTPAIGAIPADLYQGPHYGKIFGMIGFLASAGGSLGPLVFGVLHDMTGSYWSAAWLGAACSLASILLVWIAAPRKVRRFGG